MFNNFDNYKWKTTSEIDFCTERIDLRAAVAKSCKKLPKVAKNCQKLPKVEKSAKSCQILPNFAKGNQKLPKVAKSCQKL